MSPSLQTEALSSGQAVDKKQRLSHALVALDHIRFRIICNVIRWRREVLDLTNLEKLKLIIYELRSYDFFCI